MGQKSVKTVSVPCFILLRPYITVPFRFFPGRIPFSIRCTVRIDRPWTACCRPAGNTCLWFLPKFSEIPAYLLVGYFRINLCSTYAGMPHHFTDGLNWHAVGKADFSRIGVSAHVE